MLVVLHQQTSLHVHGSIRSWALTCQKYKQKTMGTVHAKSPEANFKQDKINLDGIQARVDKVHIEGLNRTKDDFVVQAVGNMFKAADFKQVVLSAHEIRNSLASFGCFKNVTILIDTSHGPDSTPHGLEVTFSVEEMNRISGSVKSTVGNNDGSLIFGLHLPNLFGRGERFQTEYSYGTKNATGFNATLSKRLASRKRASISAAVFQQANDFLWSGYRSNDRGVSLDFGLESHPEILHTVRWEGVWREINSLPASAFSVREHAGHSLKSAVKYILSIDKRDSAILPNIGYLLKLKEEFAGLGGDVSFFKSEVEFQANYPLPGGLVAQASLNAGIAKLRGESFNVCDRYFLGGPLGLRGFATRGVGPNKDDCALGATAYWASGLHLYSPLPFRPGQGGFGDLFRLHYFVNMGNINDFKFSGHDYHENLALLLDGMRLSCGAGIVLRVGQIARFELNYCVPILSQRNDKLNPGLQFGIGMEFL